MMFSGISNLMFTIVPVIVVIGFVFVFGTLMAMSHATSSTDYFVTFEVESGDRMEFLMAGTEYGQLMEGDEGKLTFQGTRYLGFERAR